MKNILKLTFLFSVLIVNTAIADPVAVIVNSANTQELSQSDVKNIYTDKTIVWKNGNNIAVYNVPPEEGATETFAQKVLGMSARNAASEEANRVITNTSRNTQLSKRDALVSSIVAKTPNAIGYIPKDLADGKPGIRVLFTLQ